MGRGTYGSISISAQCGATVMGDGMQAVPWGVGLGSPPAPTVSYPLLHDVLEGVHVHIGVCILRIKHGSQLFKATVS